jgi:RNase H-fold protein (predicted Holliday junction resolvase)
MQSEQYSSMAASSLDHHMRNQLGRRMKKPADSIDAQAAAIILQRYLDRQK